MESPIYFGLMLMIIGMSTVFAILAFVVLAGKITIILTNKSAPVKHVVEQRITLQHTETSKIAAITAAVNSVTGGKGRVTDIKKINH